MIYLFIYFIGDFSLSLGGLNTYFHASTCPEVIICTWSPQCQGGLCWVEVAEPAAPPQMQQKHIEASGDLQKLHSSFAIVADATFTCHVFHPIVSFEYTKTHPHLLFMVIVHLGWRFRSLFTFLNVWVMLPYLDKSPVHAKIFSLMRNLQKCFLYSVYHSWYANRKCRLWSSNPSPVLLPCSNIEITAAPIWTCSWQCEWAGGWGWGSYIGSSHME